MLRLAGFFLVTFLLLFFLREVPLIAPIFRIPFLGFWLTAMIVSALAARGGAWAVDRQRQAALQRRLGAVDTPHNRGKLGSLLAAQGRPRQALAHLQAARDGEPEVAEWRYRLGQTYLALGNREQGVEELRAAVAIDEEHAYGAALLSLAGAYERRGEHQASLEALERVERNHGPSPESAYRRGRALAALGRREQARAALAEVSSLAKSAARYQARDGQAWALRAYWTGLRV